MKYSEYINETINALNDSKILSTEIEEAFQQICSRITLGATIFLCGNGGSAADSQHWAAELIGEFRKKGKPMRAISLTVDTSAITSIANDREYGQVFSRQLEALGRRDDVVIAISTSGNSLSVLSAAQKAQEMGIYVLALTGQNGGKLAGNSDITIKVPSNRTEIIQHVHVTIGHFLMGALEESFREI